MRFFAIAIPFAMAALAAPTSEKRADVKTLVTMGKTKVPWGCNKPLGPIFEGLREICHSSACDEGSTFKMDVEWVPQDGFLGDPYTMTLVLSAKGKYTKESDRDHFIDAFKALATPETVGTEDRIWCDMWSTNTGGCSDKGTCPMRMFPNYININRVDGDSVDKWMDISITTDEGKGMHILLLPHMFLDKD
jgi:hypothetical protein